MESRLESQTNTVLSRLATAIQQKVPLIAVLGQKAGWQEAEPDPILEQAITRAKRDGVTWRSLLAREALPIGFYDWLGERFSRRAPPVGLELIANTPFSSVFTSSIDPGFANMFFSHGRDPQPVLRGEPGPPALRSRRRPPIYYLFGRASAGIAEMQPPVTLQALTQRRVRHANAMLRNVVESATALGLILIDGYDPVSDWLTPEELLSEVSSASPGQVIWFGSMPRFVGEAADLHAELLKTGVIQHELRALPSLLAELSDLVREAVVNWDEPEIITIADGRRIVTSPRLRLATQASATIVDDSWSDFVPPLGVHEEQEQFRLFHGSYGGLRMLFEEIVAAMQYVGTSRRRY